MSTHLSLGDWFLYSDRDSSPQNPIVGTMITVEHFWKTEIGDFGAEDWRREEWSIHSALVPVERLEAAASIVPSVYYLTCESGWDDQDQFSFGNLAEHGEILAKPLVNSMKHPVSEDLFVDLTRDFVTYHALERRDHSEYYHPVENILVAKIEIDHHDRVDPTARVLIHRDHLRDFLAATGMGLLVSVVADRFANAPTKNDLHLKMFENTKIDEFTWLTTSFHNPEMTRHSQFRGWAILNRNLIVRPYDRPRFDRSPWPYFGEHSTEESTPSFIINNEGERRSLPASGYLPKYMSEGIGNYGYLYFRPEVLQKYLNTPGYSVFFHMRNWGSASSPGDRGDVDVAMNSHGLVNAFAPHIAQLTISEQAYWASFSSLPSGEIWEEMFQTRMQQRPPHSPGLTELIENAKSDLDNVFQNVFSAPLFSDTSPNQQNLRKLSVGPVSSRDEELLELAKVLFGWVIETMQIDRLREVLTEIGGAVDPNLRQIKLLERILLAKELDEAQARLITSPLVGLNELRIGFAHIGTVKFEKAFQLIGSSQMPPRPRVRWEVCVDAVTQSLHSIARTLKAY
jgi:hypothetical protein